MRPRLLALSGALTETVFPLEGGLLTIGRDASNRVCLLDPTISKQHCRIEPSGDGYRILDLDSRNGIFLNGIPVTSALLQHGDSIRLGTCYFVFATSEHQPPSPPDSSYSGPTRSSCDAKPRPTPVPSSFGLQMGHMARDLDSLFKISSVITSIRDTVLLQRELLRLLFEVVPATSGAVFLQANEDDSPDSLAIWNRDGSETPLELRRELLDQSLWDRSSALVVGAAGPPSEPHVVCVPLIAIERTIGALYLTTPGSLAPFPPDDVHFLESVSRIAAVTLEHLLTLDALRSENGRLKRQLNPVSKMVGQSRPMAQLQQLIARVAPSDSPVLIRGESGTGKEVVARSLHESSSRSERPFVAINCAAIPETLLESELFGSEKGAFTGASVTRKGKFEAAGDGTLLLDEIGELAPSMQAKLLRVLQQREFERVGGTVSIPLRARVLAATNKDLEQAIQSGNFRRDLYYRLNVVCVTVPALREHREDIPLLALYFAARYAEKNKRAFKGISREARALLLAYDWPGNIRELENAIEHAIVLGLTDEILPEDLPTILLEQQAATLGMRYHDVLNEKKKELIRLSLEEARGNFPEAARLLGLHPKYLHRLVRNLNLSR